MKDPWTWITVRILIMDMGDGLGEEGLRENSGPTVIV